MARRRRYHSKLSGSSTHISGVTLRDRIAKFKRRPNKETALGH